MTNHAQNHFGPNVSDIQTVAHTQPYGCRHHTKTALSLSAVLFVLPQPALKNHQSPVYELFIFSLSTFPVL